LPKGVSGRGVGTLTPEIRFDGSIYLLMPQLMATLSFGGLGEKVGSIANDRDKIIRAIDTLLAGV